MKATMKLGRMDIEVEGGNQKDLFLEMSKAAEVFGEKECGLCKSPDIRPIVRRVHDDKQRKDFDYYENVCNKCGAKLSYGQSNDKVSLFPKRKLTEDGKPDLVNGKYGKHNGWTKFRGDISE